jgi:solute carrier family 25 protein 16
MGGIAVAGGGEAAGRRDFVARFCIGGVAGCCAKTVSAPLDRVKILLQARSRHYAEHRSPLKVLGQVVRKEGAPALFRGNFAQIVRIFPYSALSFVVHDYLCEVARDSGGGLTPAARFGAGATAGLVSVVATYPLDLVRARLASRVETGPAAAGFAGGMRDVLRNAVRDGGVASLYRGMVPTVYGILPYAGFNFLVYGLAREKGASLWPGAEQSTVFNLACGGFAGAVSQTATYPLDVIRRRMQLEGCRYQDPATGASSPPASTSSSSSSSSSSSTLSGSSSSSSAAAARGSSSLQMFLSIIRNEGVRALYRGISINFMRVVPTVGVSFAVNEYLKGLLIEP